jgi:hypothetical protein
MWPRWSWSYVLALFSGVVLACGAMPPRLQPDGNPIVIELAYGQQMPDGRVMLDDARMDRLRANLRQRLEKLGFHVSMVDQPGDFSGKQGHLLLSVLLVDSSVFAGGVHYTAQGPDPADVQRRQQIAANHLRAESHYRESVAQYERQHGRDPNRYADTKWAAAHPDPNRPEPPSQPYIALDVFSLRGDYRLIDHRGMPLGFDQWTAKSGRHLVRAGTEVNQWVSEEVLETLYPGE